MVQHGCSVEWTWWPSLQAAGAKENTFLAFRMFDTIGNLFISLSSVIQVRAVRLSLPIADQRADTRSLLFVPHLV